MPQEEYELIQPWVANIATAMDDKRRDYEKSTADQQIDQMDQQWKYMRQQTKWREEKPFRKYPADKLCCSIMY